MDVNWLALGAFTLVNVTGCVVSYGKMKQKVDDVAKVLDDGLIKKVDEISTTVANLQGSFDTYIRLKEK